MLSECIIRCSPSLPIGLVSFGELKASLGCTCNVMWHIRWDLYVPRYLRPLLFRSHKRQSRQTTIVHFMTTKGKRKNNSEKASGYPTMKKPTRSTTCSTKKKKVARSTKSAKSTKEKDNATKQKKTSFDER